jgi:hypothetical protein
MRLFSPSFSELLTRSLVEIWTWTGVVALCDGLPTRSWPRTVPVTSVLSLAVPISYPRV